MIKELQELIDQMIKNNTYTSNGNTWSIPKNQIKISIEQLEKIINKK